MTTSTVHPYRVRQMTSGRTGVTKYIVVKLSDGAAQRVSVHAHISRNSAQYEADDLNISEMVRPYDEDPRPYAVRRAEAAAAYQSAI